MSDRYLGEIRIFPYNIGVPEGWFECDGRVLAISDHPALYSVVGAAYGGNGTTTFALPDLRGRTPLHAGAGPGRTPRKAGDVGGAETVTLTVEQMPKHQHVIFASSNPATSASPAGGVLAVPAAGGVYLDKGAPNPKPQTFAAAALGSTGGAAHENMMPTLALRFGIAWQGI